LIQQNCFYQGGLGPEAVCNLEIAHISEKHTFLGICRDRNSPDIAGMLIP